MILINDAYWQTHGIYIKQAIMLAYPEYDEDDIINIANYTEAIQYAASNTNVEAFIRSTTGVASYVNDAKQLYPRVLFFMPMGSNSFQELQLVCYSLCQWGVTHFKNCKYSIKKSHQ